MGWLREKQATWADAHVGAFVIGLECFVNVGTLVAEVEHKGITFA